MAESLTLKMLDDFMESLWEGDRKRMEAQREYGRVIDDLMKTHDLSKLPFEVGLYFSASMDYGGPIPVSPRMAEYIRREVEEVKRPERQ